MQKSLPPEVEGIFISDMIEFKASLDRLTRVLTASVFIIIIIVLLTVIKVTSLAPISIRIGSSAGIILTIVVLALAYLYRPLKYIIDCDLLIIVRPANRKKIALKDIVEARLIEKGELRGTIRTFGSGGFFGYYGKFYNGKLGPTTWYATQRKNWIYIRLKSGRKIIITPDDLNILEMLKPKTVI